MANIGRGFDVDAFRAVLQRKGVARNNLYKMIITLPPGLQGAAGSLNIPSSRTDVEDIMLYCDEVTLPGLALVTSDNRPYGYGPQELKAYAPAFNSMSATFIVDTQSYVFSFFRNWMRGIVNYSTEGKGITSSKVNGAQPFEASFKKDYETTIELYVLDNQSSGVTSTSINTPIISKTTILRAFPIELGSAVMGYGNNDSYMRLPVTFNYFEWYADELGGQEQTSPVSNSPNYAGNSTTPGAASSTVTPGNEAPSDVNSNPALNSSTQFGP